MRGFLIGTAFGLGIASITAMAGDSIHELNLTALPDPDVVIKSGGKTPDGDWKAIMVDSDGHVVCATTSNN